jgi:Uma2 family endonuclease
MMIRPALRAFTVDDYYRMAETGILAPGERLELLDGAVVEMSPIGVRHASVVSRLTHLLISALSDRVEVRVQNPVRLDERSEPEPDIAVLHRRGDFYAEAHPGPGDVFVLIEVADASILVDRNVKIPLYARASVPEVWLIDLQRDQIEVYAEPVSEMYRVSEHMSRSDRVALRAFPDTAFDVAEILG